MHHFLIKDILLVQAVISITVHLLVSPVVRLIHMQVATISVLRKIAPTTFVLLVMLILQLGATTIAQLAYQMPLSWMAS